MGRWGGYKKGCLCLARAFSTKGLYISSSFSFGWLLRYFSSDFCLFLVITWLHQTDTGLACSSPSPATLTTTNGSTISPHHLCYHLLATEPLALQVLISQFQSQLVVFFSSHFLIHNYWLTRTLFKPKERLGCVAHLIIEDFVIFLLKYFLIVLFKQFFLTENCWQLGF